MSTSQIDIAILFALKEEFELLHEQVKAFAIPKLDDISGHFDYIFESQAKTTSAVYRCVTTFSNEMGPTAAALMTERIIKLWNPATIAFVGIAGGVSDDVRLCDVVVATQVDEYLARAKAVETKGQKKAARSFNLLTAGEVYRPSASLHRAAINLQFAKPDFYDAWRIANSNRLNSLISSAERAQLEKVDAIRSESVITTGHIASGPVVSASTSYLDWLKNRDRSIICLEMESAGFLAAVYDRLESRNTVVIRGISDFGDARKSSIDKINKGAIRKVAALNAIDLLFVLMHTEQLSHTGQASGFSDQRSEKLLALDRDSRERCATSWEALQVPTKKAKELSLDDRVGSLPSHLLADAGGLKLVLAPLGSGKTLAAERCYQAALKKAMTDAKAPTPLFVDCSTLNGRTIEELAHTRIHDVSSLVAHGVDIFIDGLDELTPKAAIQVISQARIIVRNWKNSRCHLFSRPRQYPVAEADVLVLPELDERTSLDLVARIAEDQRLLFLHSYPAVVTHSIRRPLFAILLGVYRRSRSTIPKSRSDLFVALSETALQNVIQSSSNVVAILRKLASQSLSSGFELVLNRDLPLSAADMDALQATGFIEITAKAVGFRFVLPILKEWFAAQALIHADISTDMLVGSTALVERWRHAVAIAISTTPSSRGLEIMRPIVERLPASAAIIVDEAIVGWGHGDVVVAPSKDECETQVGAAMALWIEGMGALRVCLAAVDEEGRLRQVHAKTGESWLSTSWKIDRNRDLESSQHPAFGDSTQILSFTSAGIRSARPGNSPAWALRWTLDECVDDVGTWLGTRAFISDDGPLRDEFAWLILREFAAKTGTSRGLSPIDLTLLRDALEQQHSAHPFEQIRLPSGNADFRLLITEIDRYLSKGIVKLPAPMPLPDLTPTSNAWRSQQYSPERLVELANHVYSSAISEYRLLVETFFPKFSTRLWHYAMLPFRLVGRIRDEEFGPWMDNYIIPLNPDADPEVDVRISRELDGDRFDGVLDTVIYEVARLRSENSSWLGARTSREAMRIFGNRPVTTVVYNWLQSDLYGVKWAKNPTPVNDSND